MPGVFHIAVTRAWLGLTWLGLAWLGLAWLAWLRFAWLGLAKLRLAWLGSAWLGLACLALAQESRNVQSINARPALISSIQNQARKPRQNTQIPRPAA